MYTGEPSVNITAKYEYITQLAIADSKKIFISIKILINA